MKSAIAAALMLAALASAQTRPQPHGRIQHHLAATSASFTDPANLRGERVAPLTGRELPIDQGARGLEQMLRRLNTRASLLLIVAHPDDEDGGMLTAYSRGLGARVATLTLTRGEGGQNAVTGDFEDALGLIRTQELLSADRYFGAGQMFGTEVDFGFSKTKEEAFSKWTHQRVLYDAVRAVRLYRPLVIAAVFIGGVTDGHGQHQVSGEIAQEVFKAAGDPKIFPELTAQGILPWQPLKVYARVPTFAITDKGLFDYATNQYAPARFTNYVSGETTSTPPSADIVVHEGQTDPLLSGPGEAPRSYVQFARIGLGLQRTQIGPNVRLAVPGSFDVSYHRYGSRLPNQPLRETTFFDGMDTSLAGLATLAPDLPSSCRAELEALSGQIARATSVFTALQSHGREPQVAGDAVATVLAEALRHADALIAGVQASRLSLEEKANLLHELRIKRVQLNDATALALGLSFDGTVDSPSSELQAGHPVEVNTRLATASTQTLPYQTLSVENSAGDRFDILTEEDQTAVVTAGKPAQEPIELDADLARLVSRPYFSRPDIEQPFYNLRDPELRNAPATTPSITAWIDLSYQGIKLRLGRVVHVGDQPVRLVPPASLTLSTHAQVLPDDVSSARLTASLHPVQTPPILPELSVPAGWKPAVVDTGSAAAGQTTFAVNAPRSARAAILLRAVAKLPRTGSIAEGYRPVGYPGIPLTDFFRPATDHIVPVDLKLPVHRRIGYLPGTGDAVPEALASIDLPVTPLTVADLTPAKLAQFDTVILGVRTYNAHPDLHGAPTEALLNFARDGGNVVVQYQTYEFTGADAPFPLTLGNAEKVVDETDAVRLLEPSAPALLTPNRLTSADFNNWIEERGHGFLHTWDPHYSALTETHDPGQLPQEGGLITTALGRGHWTYCAFALYRQLPEAVPGAFRILTNLLALADTPQP